MSAIIRDSTALDQLLLGDQINYPTDLMVEGDTPVGTFAGDLFLRTDDNAAPASVAIRADQKIFIDSRWTYGDLDTNWFGADALLVDGGVGTKPVTFTNIGGQVLAETINIRGLVNFKMTGKYDPVEGTGHIDYKGHDTVGGFATAENNYGFQVSPGWANTGTTAVGIFKDLYGTTEKGSSNVEVEYIQVGNGGNAGIQLKNDHMSDANGGTMYGCSVHDILALNPGGEGFYCAHTGTGDDQHTLFLHLYDTVCSRTGREGWQAGRLGKGSILENNVLESCAMGWMRANPDGGWNFQDKAMQIGCRNGGVIIRNNVARGGGSHNLFFQMDGSGDDRVSAEFVWVGTEGDFSTYVDIQNNAFFGSRDQMAYFQKSNMDLVTNSYIVYRDNLHGFRRFEYDDLDPVKSASSFYITGNNNISFIEAIDNKKDTADDLFGAFSPVTTRLTEVGTITDLTMDPYLFSASGNDDSTYPFPFLMEIWVEFIAAQGGGVTATPRAYPLGAVVRYVDTGLLWECILAHDGSNAAVTEPEVGSGYTTYWQPANFGGRREPIVDLRPKQGSTYHTAGIGLSTAKDTNLTVAPAPYGGAKDKLRIL